MRQVRFWALVPVSLLATFSATLLTSPAVDSRVLVENAQFNSTLSYSERATVALAAGKPANLSSLERGIVAETNRARTNPVAYAAQIQNLKKYYKGNKLQIPGQITIITQEGVKPVNEAISFLKSAKPLPALRVSRGMSLGAKDHVKDQGPKGAIGHNSSDGSKPWDRVNRYGSWQVTVGENISYGPNTAQQVVMQLLIDDGVADRGHRKNIFKGDFRVTGVACGPHKQYGTMCVIDYAGGYKEGR